MKPIAIATTRSQTACRQLILAFAVTAAAITINALIVTSSSGQQTDDAIHLNPGASEREAHRLLVTVRNARLMLKHNVSVASREAGIVTEVPVTEGDDVSEAETIVQLDNRLFKAQLQTTVQQRLIAGKESENDIELRYAKKSAAVNQKVLARSTEASKAYRKSVSKTELERLKLELERSCLSAEQAAVSGEVKELTYELRTAEQRLAEIRLDNRSIKSPVRGEIVEVLVQVGQYVNAGQPVARVISMDHLKVEAYVSSDEVALLRKGQAATIKASFNNESLSSAGTVSFVSPEIDPLNGDVRVVVEIDNRDRRFRPGMLVELAIGQ